MAATPLSRRFGAAKCTELTEKGLLDWPRDDSM
jgi:hypothetical protein